MATIGQNLRGLLASSRMSGKDLAEAMGVTAPVVSNWLNDKSGLPELPTLFRMAVALRCSIEEIVAGVDQAYEEARSRSNQNAVAKKLNVEAKSQIARENLISSSPGTSEDPDIDVAVRLGQDPQASTIKFTPTTAQTYSGTLTVNANQTSGTNTLPFSAIGVFPPRPNFSRSGVGDTVFDMPVDVARVHIIGIYTANSSNFVVRIGGRLIVNELIGTGWGTTRYDGTLLTGGGGVVAITNSSGVQWSIEEIR